MSTSILTVPAVAAHNGNRFGAASPKDIFEEMLALYRRDPKFCVPAEALDVICQHGEQTSFVLLGISYFSSVFGLMKNAKVRILYVVDDFKANQGADYHGIEIISTDKFLQIAEKDKSVVAINCCRHDYSKRFFDNLCRNHGVPHLNHEQAVRALAVDNFSDYRAADWAPTILSRSTEFSALAGRLGDSYSVDTLYSVLTFHLTCDPEWHLNISRPYSTLYFRSGLFSWGQHEKMVDCGASIGESTTALIGVTQGRFERSWMIEPDKFNIPTLQKLLRKYDGTPIREKLVLHQFAVGEISAEASFLHQGGHGGSIAFDVDASMEKVLIRPVDEIIDEVPTFIKMDIEGYEFSALKGCARSIQAGLPKMAISAYHRSTDLLDIIQYVDSIAPGYKVGLRHHTEDRWDTCLYFYH